MNDEAPLTPREVAEAKRHLKVLQRYRKELRLKVNAEEDLLLAGAREPHDRRVLRHLLGKIDLGSVQGALEREPDPAGRTRLLAGVSGFSSDPGVLILYLESLVSVDARRQAAGAFSQAVGRLDVAALSDARLRRLLDVFAQTFEGEQRVSALFGLLHSPAVRGRIDEVLPQLPDDLRAAVAPLLAVYEAVIEGEDPTHPPHVLQRGCTLLLAATPDTLRAYPEDVRVRLLESAVSLLDGELADRAAITLLETIPAQSDAFARLASLRAADLMRRHQDDRARWLLRRLAGTPGGATGKRWLAALDAKGFGRLAPPAPSERPPDPTRKGLQAAFWLDGQRDVWARVGPKEIAGKLLGDAEIHGSLGVAGIAPLLGAGTDTQGRPWLAVPRLGALLHERDPVADSLEDALQIALAAALVLGTLARLGLTLPDARRWRFLLAPGPRLWLADLAGIKPADESAAWRGASAGAQAFAREQLAAHEPVLPPALRQTLARRKTRHGDLVAALAASV